MKFLLLNCRMMKKLVLILLLLCPLALGAQDLYEQYIEKYADMAIEEMYRSGVPASITLAQGLLESGMGRSTLATTANNHFGIKCHSWTGLKVYYDDDVKNECFRKYKSVEESFQDHSDFLRYKDRYSFLFDLEPTDYKGWCYGLKQAGYATDPNYANKLINVIEKYRLYEFDRTGEDSRRGTARPQSPQPSSPSSSGTGMRRPSRQERELPKSPSQMESLRKAEDFSFSLAREVYERNGVPCVVAVEGESYASIAAQYDLFLKEILRFNDAGSDRAVLPGELVYIRAKRKHTEKGLDKHICDVEGEQLRDIAQRYGVTLKSLLKLNGLKADAQLHESDVVLLRKTKK